MSERAWARPAAGREPAGAALLAWLADPVAPRLCLVTGSAGRGKSALLAWLVGHGTRPGTVPERRVHGFVPLAGQGVRATVWTLAEQLEVAARAPGELVTALAADPRRTVVVLPDLHAGVDAEALAELVSELAGLDHVRLVVEARTGHDAVRLLSPLAPAVMDLDEPRWTDPARYADWRSAEGRGSDGWGSEPETGKPVDGYGGVADGDEPLDPADPVSVCTTDPTRVTTAYETDTGERGGLRAAWLRAGQSLISDQEPAERALTLLAALGDGADPRLRPALADLAASAPWKLVWSRVRGDVAPPWPGPALALTTGAGPLEGQFVAADHQGVLRTVSLGDAAPVGRLSDPVPEAVALGALPDGTVAVLDAQGQLHTRRLPTAPRPSGLAALLDDGPAVGERAVEVQRARLEGRRGTAVSASGYASAVADAAGFVSVVPFGEEASVQHAAQLHESRVTALALVDVPVGDSGSGESVSLVYSGGADGRVRAWGPGTEPLAVPVAERPCAVVALAATYTTSGLVLAIGWADGLIEHRRLDVGETRTVHPGVPVNALALTPAEHLVIGTDEMVICLSPR
ncbi:hypothetical protein ACFS5L_04435 [Streptomyces phyllanthi]|uniref:WD40 repeat domain-containing protein n=1 Tax=Streptomyces phyllanthi TaxID=1803180 RepID=A0A5N8WC49_9ACTN|nr:hypothetical protein [Streptomyces phyllanthi]MPY44712.1 hypothetical protein [Streptomyces phyllanthi]